MNHELALSRAKSLLKYASNNDKSTKPVDDETWKELIEVGDWVKKHGRAPRLLKHAIPLPDSTRTWLTVKCAAQAIVDSLTGERRLA